MLDAVSGLPAQIIYWHDRLSDIDLRQGQVKLHGAVCGGLSRDEVNLGTPGAIREQARDAIAQTYSRRFILSTAQNLMQTTPLSNMRMVRQVVEPTG